MIAIIHLLASLVTWIVMVLVVVACVGKLSKQSLMIAQKYFKSSFNT